MTTATAPDLVEIYHKIMATDDLKEVAALIASVPGPQARRVLLDAATPERDQQEEALLGAWEQPLPQSQPPAASFFEQPSGDQKMQTTSKAKESRLGSLIRNVFGESPEKTNQEEGK